MKSYLPAAAMGFALTAAAFGFGAATAHAAGYTNENAGQVGSELQAMGYAVQINGSTTGALSQCMVTGVEGLTSGQAVGTAYIDVTCPGSNN
ncbi:MAG: hypothetical protein ACKOQ4_03285 [Mycobacterium sp.]